MQGELWVSADEAAPSKLVTHCLFFAESVAQLLLGDERSL